jgi:hypothetical protein
VVTVDSSGLQVEHVRVTYDVAAAGAAVIAAGLPAEFAAFLASGGRAPGASATATPTF